MHLSLRQILLVAAVVIRIFRERPRAIALWGSRTGLAEEQAQPVIIVEGGAEFTTADTVARGPLWRNSRVDSTRPTAWSPAQSGFASSPSIWLLTE